MSVSTSYAIIGLAVFVALGATTTTVQNTGEEVTDTLGDQLERSDNVAETDIEVLNASYGGGTLFIYVENTGKTRLSAHHTDILVDGKYVPLTPQNISVEGEEGSRVWARGERLQIRADVAPPERLKVVTERGIADFTAVSTFQLTNNIVFTDSDNIKLRSPGLNASIRSFGETAQVIGPSVAQFSAGGVFEVPAVDSNGDLFLITGDGDRIELATGADKTKSKLAAGRWQGSEPSIFYVTQNNQDLARVTPDGTTTVLSASTPKARGVSGFGDVDGDGADELVYGGSKGSDDTVRYIDDDGTSVTNTQAQYGSNNGIGLGEPGDFDGDGTDRVPIVGGGQEIKLVDSSGNTETLVGSGSPNKAPIGVADLDTDGAPEIYFVGENQKLSYVDDVTGQNTVKDLTDETGGTIPVDNDAGVA